MNKIKESRKDVRWKNEKELVAQNLYDEECKRKRSDESLVPKFLITYRF